MNQDILNFDMDFGLSFSLDENQEIYQLPRFVNCDFNGKKQPINIKEKVLKLPENIRDSTLQVAQTLESHLKIWDIPPVTNNYEDNCYVFILPPSYFQGNCQIFPVRPDLLRNEYNQVQELTSNQISQIFSDGTFEMPSQQFPIPYVWQLSQFIIKGRKNILKSYYNDLGIAYKIMKSTPTYIYSQNDHTGNPCTLRAGFYNFCSKLCVFGSIFVGFRETYTNIDQFSLENQTEKRRQLQLRLIQDLRLSIYEYLKFANQEGEYEAASQKRQLLIEAFKLLEQQLQGLRLQIQNQYDTMIEQQGQNDRFDDLEEKKEYLDNLNEQIKLLEEDYIKKYQIKLSVDSGLDEQIENALIQAQSLFLNSYFPQDKQVVDHLVQLVECKRNSNYYQELKNDETKTLLDEFEQRLIKDHPIRQYSERFISQEKQQYAKNIRSAINEKYRIQLVQDLRNSNIKDVEIYLQYHKVKKDLKHELQQIIEEEKINRRGPNINNTVVRVCFPPYKVIKTGAYFKLEREIVYNVDSNCFFWKIQLMIIRYYAWTANVMYWLFANGIQGPLGIRSLFACSIYYPDVTIDVHTGVVTHSHYSVTPIIVHLTNVCDGMRASRREFEDSPDTGFFGKNCARLCNLIEVYFFRLIIVGIIGVLIIMPLLILMNFTISIVLALTAWVWIPVVLIFLLIIQITFYDFDVVNRNENNILSSPVCFPLLVNLWNFVIHGFFMIIINLMMVVAVIPISSIFMLIFGHIRYILRSLYDCFMILLVKCLGRVPASENSLAWKISGPGISRGYYFSIKNEEAIILVAAELERCIMSEYETRIKQKIMQPQKDLQSIMTTFFSIFGASYNFNDSGCERLKTCLTKQIDLRNSCLPTIQNTIRFDASELQLLKMQIKQFIKNQIKLKNMNNFIWNRFNVQKGDYNLLTETILKKIFGTQIMQPLEALDMRFQLQTEENHQFELKVQKALKGQVNLSKPENYIQKQIVPTDCKKIYKKFVSYKEIVDEVWSCQGLKQTWSSIASKYKRFYINYCLQAGLD